MTTKREDHPEDIVVIKHPKIEATGTSTRAAFDAVWADRGYRIAGVDTHYGDGTGAEPSPSTAAESADTSDTASPAAAGSGSNPAK